MIVSFQFSSFVYAEQSGPASNETYSYQFRLKGALPLAKTADKEDVPESNVRIKYIEKFDLSQSGNGNFSNGDRSVTIFPTAGVAITAYSKPTLPVFEYEADEVRIKFSVGGKNYANGLILFDYSTNNRIAMWYNHTNTLYLYDNKGDNTRVVASGQGSVMEFRFSFAERHGSFYVDEILVNEFSSDVIAISAIAAKVFEGSLSPSSLTIL